MRIKWLAHASFLIQGGGGVRIITDPYTPEEMNFGYIKEPADIVIRSSSDDEGHCFAEMIQGHPEVATATEFADQQIIVKGIPISAISTQESLIYKQDPRDNAMYRFELDDIRVGHFGDVGNRLTEDHLSKMSGIDVALVPTGGPPTIDLEDSVYGPPNAKASNHHSDALCTARNSSEDVSSYTLYKHVFRRSSEMGGIVRNRDFKSFFTPTDASHCLASEHS